MIGVKDKIWSLRQGLFAKYVFALVGLVVFVLAVNGALETWISYRATKTTLTDAMGEKAEATARRIEQSISELERQISWVTRASAQTLEQHRADYAQLLNQVAAVSQLSLLDGNGREQLRLSRTTISVGNKTDFSRDFRFTETAARGVSYAPAEFRGSRPFMSISVAHSGFNAGVTVADIDLRFLVRFPRRRPGRQGRLRLCGRSQGQGAGKLGQGAGGRQGSLGAAAGRQPDEGRRDRWRRAPTPTAMRY